MSSPFCRWYLTSDSLDDCLAFLSLLWSLCTTENCSLLDFVFQVLLFPTLIDFFNFLDLEDFLAGLGLRLDFFLLAGADSSLDSTEDVDEDEADSNSDSDDGGEGLGLFSRFLFWPPASVALLPVLSSCLSKILFWILSRFNSSSTSTFCDADGVVGTLAVETACSAGSASCDLAADGGYDDRFDLLGGIPKQSSTTDVTKTYREQILATTLHMHKKERRTNTASLPEMATQSRATTSGCYGTATSHVFRSRELGFSANSCFERREASLLKTLR